MDKSRSQMIDEAVRLARTIWCGGVINVLTMHHDKSTITLQPGALEMIRAEFRRIRFNG